MPELSKKTPTAAGAGDAPRLESDLLERVLDRLGFSRAPKATLEGLTAVYGAWCQRVPFDNVRKIIHIASGAPTPLPGTTASDFFKAWLKFGVGGTCWSGAGACYALLASLGFNASRGIATMLAAPDLPPNHGTVLVSFGPEKYLVDSAMLHGVPLRLEDVGETIIDHPAWGLRVLHRGGQTYISWRPLHKLDGFECRLERFGAARQEYEALYNRTRPWSPFNFELSFRINRGEDVI
ncbi:MAG TPA: arylamine N-acetyltransferase, partial [Verrucomicrobiae bacterium]|nr:arylamine N-acetyltransferase [Verrucomicrobiae bacterium]